MARLPENQGFTLEEAMNKMASDMSSWGKDGQAIAQLKKDLMLSPDKTPSQKLNTVVDDTLDPTPKHLEIK